MKVELRSYPGVDRYRYLVVDGRKVAIICPTLVGGFHRVERNLPEGKMKAIYGCDIHFLVDVEETQLIEEQVG